MQTEMSQKLSIAIDLLADMIIHYLSTNLMDSTYDLWLKQTLWRQIEQESMARMEHEMLVEMLGSKHFRRVA